MKVAILGYGRQGKKHSAVWAKLGYSPDIFTRTGGEETKVVTSFVPNGYHIIICAISPIDEQTRMIQYIIEAGFKGYLIIEKPITYSIEILKILEKRKKTVFFIDEAYASENTHTIINQVIDIKVYGINNPKMAIGMIEHALGSFFMQIEDIIYNATDIKLIRSEKEFCIIGTNAGHFQYAFDGGNDTVGNGGNFDITYKTLLEHIHNESFMENIRRKYILFRESILAQKYYIG